MSSTRTLGVVRTAETQPPAYQWSDIEGIKLSYIRNIGEANQAISRLSPGPTGFDLEWRPNFRRGEAENPVALVQIATFNTILLIQVSAMGGYFPECLKQLMEDPRFIKTGVGIQDDVRKLEKDFNVSARNCVDLSLLAKSVDNEHWKGRYNNSIGLARLVQFYENRLLMKGSVTRSNWEANLTPRQQQYAANDAHAGIAIYKRLIAMISLASIPPLPKYYTFDYVHGGFSNAGASWLPANPDYDPGPPPIPKVQPPPKASDILVEEPRLVMSEVLPPKDKQDKPKTRHRKRLTTTTGS